MGGVAKVRGADVVNQSNRLAYQSRRLTCQSNRLELSIHIYWRVWSPLNKPSPSVGQQQH